jgi:hypothetical protein
MPIAIQADPKRNMRIEVEGTVEFWVPGRMEPIKISAEVLSDVLNSRMPVDAQGRPTNRMFANVITEVVLVGLRAKAEDYYASADSRLTNVRDELAQVRGVTWAQENAKEIPYPGPEGDAK